MGFELGIVVVTYNTKDYLERCLKSLFEHTNANSYVVVVDSGSTDGTGKMLEEKFFDKVELLSEDNIGYAKGVNLGMKFIKDRYPEISFLCFMNADIEFTKDWDIPLLQLLSSDKKIAAVGPKMIDDKNRIMAAGVVGANDRPSIRFWMEDDHGQGEEDAKDCVMLCGALQVVKSDVFFATGCLLETPLYYEETGWNYYIRHLGYRTVYCGKSKIYHFWDKAPKTQDFKSKCFSESREIFRKFCDDHGILHD